MLSRRTGTVENGFLSRRDRRAAIKCHCVSHRAHRDHKGLEFLSRILERPIRLKLTWACSEKRGDGLIFPLRKSNQGYLLSDLCGLERSPAPQGVQGAAGER